jgi:serine/threonine-protein kinase
MMMMIAHKEKAGEIPSATGNGDATVAARGSSLPKSLFGYEVLEFIGQGAGSLIYAVSQPQSNQIYALKHVVRRTDKDERFIQQLEAEYEVGRSVHHPGLRRSIDMKLNRTGLLRKVSEAALVLELFDGQPLETHPPRRMSAVCDVFAQVAKALGALHHAGYCHCDLKPNNILVNNAGEVKVIDLGQACKLNTKKQRIQGTPDYIAPEQVKCDAVTVRTDVYNLGATLYWVLTGKNVPTLFTVAKSGGANAFLVDDGIPTPLELNPKTPETLSNLVMECVRVNPAKRPGDMSDLARRLDVIGYAAQRAAQGHSPTHGVRPALVPA